MDLRNGQSPCFHLQCQIVAEGPAGDYISLPSLHVGRALHFASRMWMKANVLPLQRGKLLGVCSSTLCPHIPTGGTTWILYNKIAKSHDESGLGHHERGLPQRGWSGRVSMEVCTVVISLPKRNTLVCNGVIQLWRVRAPAKNSQTGAGGWRDGSVKLFLCKNKDQISFDPRTYVKSQAWWCSLAVVRQRQEYPRALLTSVLIGKLQPSERSYLKWSEQHPWRWYLRLSCVTDTHVHTCTCTYTHTMMHKYSQAYEKFTQHTSQLSHAKSHDSIKNRSPLFQLGFVLSENSFPYLVENNGFS